MKSVDLIALVAVCVLLLYHTHTVDGQSNGVITRQEEEVVRKVGASGTVNCTVSTQGSNKDAILVEWMFLNASDGGKSVSSDCRITEEHNKLVGKEKYEIKCFNMQTNIQRYSLTVNALSPTDNGFYECRVRLSNEPDPKERMKVKITVLSPPKVLLSSVPLAVDSFINASMSISCAAEGVPAPNVTWGRANGRPLPKDRYISERKKIKSTITNQTLTIFNLTKADRGTYRCSADNNIRPPDDFFSMISIQFKPSASPVEPTYGAAPGENSQIMMWCQVDGNPRPSMTWYGMTSTQSRAFTEGNLELNARFFANAKMILTDDKYRVEQKIMTVGSLSTMESMFYSLTVLTVESSDLVYYVCRAVNTHGTAHTAIKLYEVNTYAGENNPATRTLASVWMSSVLLILARLFIS